MFTYQNVQESRRQARRADCYSRNMEDLATVTLHISQKTEKETVTMKIISWVTILFLPATFISVSWSDGLQRSFSRLEQTLMSTDIVKYTTEEPEGDPHLVFSFGALKLFLAIALPLTTVTVLTLLFWRLRSRHAREQQNPGISPA